MIHGVVRGPWRPWRGHPRWRIRRTSRWQRAWGGLNGDGHGQAAPEVEKGEELEVWADGTDCWKGDRSACLGLVVVLGMLLSLQLSQ